jgi:hypothetical protein
LRERGTARAGRPATAQGLDVVDDVFVDDVFVAGVSAGACDGTPAKVEG